jgi:hypothetical protein
MAGHRSLCRPRVHTRVRYIVYVPRGACCALKVLFFTEGLVPCSHQIHPGRILFLMQKITPLYQEAPLEAPPNRWLQDINPLRPPCQINEAEGS